MAKIKNLKRNLRRVRYGADTWKEFFLRYLDSIAKRTVRKTNSYVHVHARRLVKIFTQGNIYQIRDIKFPVLDKEDEILFWQYIFDDTLG